MTADESEPVPTFEQMLAAMHECESSLEGSPHSLRHDVVASFGQGPMQLDFVLLLTADLLDAEGGAASLRCSVHGKTIMASCYGVIAQKLRETAAQIEKLKPREAGACVLWDSSKPDQGPAQA